MIASYGPLVDRSDRKEHSRRLAELWVKDGIYDIDGISARQGPAAIAEVFGEGHLGQVSEGVCHVVDLPYVSVRGDEATAFNYSCVFRPHGEDRFFAWRVSANRWDLIRRNGRWLIRRRTNRLMTGKGDALALVSGIELTISEDARAER